MAWWRRHKKQQQGQAITARNLRQMAQTCDYAAQMRADPPLAIMATAGGPLLRLANAPFSAYIAVVVSPITPRSGPTPGSGTVKLQTWDTSELADLDGPVIFTAYNFSSSSTGIASGKYCVILRIDGSYWVISAEC